MKKNNGLVAVVAVIISIIALISITSNSSIKEKIERMFNEEDDGTFRIISTNANAFYDEDIKEFAEKENIDLQIDHFDDLEIVEQLNSEDNKYDGVWISNSIWLYMLNNSYLVENSKSIAMSPVVMAVKKNKAQELGFIKDEIYNKDILDAIKEGKLKYVMNSVTKTNTGATAYLGLLNNLAGNPEVLKLEMLKSPVLRKNLKEFFSGVERVSGDEDYLEKMFLNGDYEAVINYESTLISLNQKLIAEGKEPLYLIYPKDGVAINDMPFGYVERNQGKEENFQKIQKFLRNKTTSDKLKENGLRTWFGGITTDVNTKVFNKDWGIDTTKYLMPLKYPSKTVINEAFNLYLEELRKPTHTVFVLDISGSMNSNRGLEELKESMNYILNQEEAKKEQIQFSKNDKITVITFNSKVDKVTNTYTGDNTKDLINIINGLYATGGTNIYDSSIKALEILNNDTSDYMKTVILMTDGESNSGTFYNLKNFYTKYNLDIPIYCITFGSSSEYQLKQIEELTNSKIFDGKTGLIEAFKEVRSYN